MLRTNVKKQLSHYYLYLHPPSPPPPHILGFVIDGSERRPPFRIEANDLVLHQLIDTIIKPLHIIHPYDGFVRVEFEVVVQLI